MKPRTMFDRIWNQHVVAELGDGWALLHLDRILLHDLSGGRALQELAEAGRHVAQPRLVFATPDHAVSSRPGRTAASHPPGQRLVTSLRERPKPAVHACGLHAHSGNSLWASQLPSTAHA